VLGTLKEKDFQENVPEIEETVGPLSTCGRELLLVGLVISFIIFTASVRNILDTLPY
jgi:hypothetical protein